MTSTQPPKIGEGPPVSEQDYQKALNVALRLLTRRDHSKDELTRKLRQRGIQPEVIDKVILACEEFDYINDERTARLFIGQLARKGYGIKHIRQELKMKGLKGKHIPEILAESISEYDEREGAERILQKHAKKFERESDPQKRKEKVYRFLYARGFSKDVILELMREFL
jgi:regulatory protein